MGEMDVRTVMEQGNSLAISLPFKFVRRHNIKKGDKVKVYFNKKLLIELIEKEEVKKKLGEAEGTQLRKRKKQG